jgi:hypothetical protein
MHTLTAPSAWKNDSAIDRIRVRVRLIVAIAPIAVMLGGMFGARITAAMHRVVVAVEQLDTARHENPDLRSGFAIVFPEAPPGHAREATVIFKVHPVFFLVIATTLEVCGDAVVRIALYGHPGLTPARVGLFLIGAVLLFGYGSFLNLAPLEFRQVVGLYTAILFVVWQIINFTFFRTLPTTPIVVGGILIIAGGTIVSFWRQ